MKKILILVTFLTSLILNAEGLKGDMKAYNVFLNNGEEQLKEATEVVAGGVIEYQIVYNNEDKTPYNNVGIKGNIPNGTTFVLNSNTKKPTPVFSIDQGQTWSKKPKVKEIVNGKLIEKEAPVSSYNAIKWNIKEIKGKTQVVLKYRIKIND